jgi:diguanylate cyclase (GGDEF)-like protein
MPHDDLLTMGAVPHDVLPGRGSAWSLSLSDRAPIFVALSFGVMLAVGAGLLVSQLRRNALDNSGQELQRLALVLADQAERTFEAVELVQESLVERLKTDGVKSPEQFRQRMTGLAAHEDMLNRIHGLPQLDALIAVDADGSLLNFSHFWPPPTVTLADRDYFKALKTNTALTTYFGEPVTNRGTGTLTQHLARKVTGPEGQFLGLILGAVELAYFERLYESLSLGNDTSILVRRDDGRLLARFPTVDARNGPQFNPVEPFSDMRRSGQRSSLLQRTSSVDGQERLMAFRLLQRYPLVVGTTKTVWSALTEWRQQTSYLIGATVLLELMVLSLGLLMARHMRNQRTLSEEHAGRLRAEADAQLGYMAQHDALTGLPNRLLFRTRLQEELIRSRRGAPFAVLCLDLDGFKDVNDSLGHPVGDVLLQAVTVRLRQETRETDTVARLGGDEFAIIQAGAEQPAAAIALAERLVARLAEPFDLDIHQVAIGVSIGIAMLPGDGEGADIVLKNADLALYRAKGDGRGTFRLFEPAMDAAMRRRSALVRDLRHGLEIGQFELFYQPIMDKHAVRIQCFEALIRWRHPERGLVLPAEFIAVTEEIGLIRPLGAWVLAKACADAMHWPERIGVAVNLSSVQFINGNLLQDVRQALWASGLAPHRLELEVTETVLMQNSEATLALLNELKSLGVSIALDDFGAGYSSPGYLRKFPFDRVKIDKSFVHDLRHSGDATAIVRSVTSLCRALGIATTAEGVETAQQFDGVLANGCTHVQGYLFSPPVPAAEIPALCEKLQRHRITA